LSGSAINDNAAISAVAIYIDGNSYGNANYGLSRTDVCSSYPGRPGCPNVGWTYFLDTTALTNGSHTLTVVATAANGQQQFVSTLFTVVNWTSNYNPFQISIDAPGSTPLTGTAAITGGWAYNSFDPLSAVTVSVDGVPMGTAFYGGARPDVCVTALALQVPACPNISWTYLLDTTQIADGTHTMAVTATTVEGQSYTTSKQFSVANLGTPSGIRIGIDRPSAANGPITGTAALGGWAISDNGTISQVSIAVDGVTVTNAVYGGSRMDVCNAFPNRQGCPGVGWNALLDTTLYANGTHVLDVTAKDATGKTATASTTFTISN
jgi:hypothetical protein